MIAIVGAAYLFLASYEEGFPLPGRYQLAWGGGGYVYRINTYTGEIAVCAPDRDDVSNVLCGYALSSKMRR
jgi:hypothetical protein